MTETEEKLKSLASRVGRLELKVNTLIDTVNKFNYNITEIYSLLGRLAREEQGYSETQQRIATSSGKFKSIGIISHHHF